jgi:hypothetical protein
MDKYQLLASLENQHGLPNGLLKSVMTTESGGNGNAVSPKGARGYFQFMPATAKAYGVNPTDFNSSATGAARMYADLLKQHNGDLDKALASYNWGSGNVSKIGLEKAPTETKNYITKVKSGMDETMDTKPWEDFAPEQASSAPWEDFAPSKTTQPKARSFEDDLKAELEANPIGAKLAAFGTAASDLYQGGKQLIGMGDKEAIRNNRIIAGANPGSALAGNVALYSAGGVLAPVFNTAKGAALVGTAAGALAPVEGDNVAKQKLINAGIGGATGYGITKGVNATTNALTNNAANKALLKAQNATRDASLKAAQEAGYTVPRSLYNPSFLSNRLESVAGKAATKQQSAAMNQGVTNSLARQSLGLGDDVPLSVSTIEGVRKSAYKPYEQVAKLSDDAASTLEQLKQARADAKGWFTAYNRSARPDDLAKAKQFQLVADQAEETLNKYATAAGRDDLIPDLIKARKTIAKTYTLDRAMNNATGDIDAAVLGRLYNKGSPLSDGLDTAGRFAAQFPQIAKANANNPTAGVSKVEALAMAGLGLGGAYGTDSPYGAAAGLLPLLSHPARAAALSKLMQSSPNYAQGITPELLKRLLSTSYAPMALTGAAIPTLTK